MSEILRSPAKSSLYGGKKGVYIHDKLCSDGPKDPETGKPLIDPATGEEYPGPNDDMSELLHHYLVILRSLMNVSGTLQTVPRFGVLSLIAMHTPIYVYDHPAFKKVANTAFTDGINVFIDADFMRKLVAQEEDCDGKKSGVLFTILHELLHKLYYHVDRLKSFDPRIANIAEDMVINGKLIKGFPEVAPVDLLLEICYGVKAEEAEKYHSMAEEVVAEMLELQRRKRQQEKNKNKGQGQSGGGSGSGSGGNSSGDQDDQNDQDDEENEEYSPIHHITPEDLLDIIEKNGLDQPDADGNSVASALNLPKKDDIDGIGKMKDRAKMNDVDAIQNAISQAAKCGGNYPGAHIAEEASDLIGGLEKGKITWKLAIKKHIMGDGQKLQHTDDEANITWYLDKGTLGTDPFYTGALVPIAPDETVMCLVDSSGSTMGGNMRREFMQEVLNLKRGVSSQSDCARKVILFSADTVLRGEPIEITDANLQKFLSDGVPMFGNGGTDFLSCLKEALQSKIMKKEKVKTVIYFTDCYDHTPNRSDFAEYLEKGVKFLFVTTPGTWNEAWNAGVSDWAEVICIEEGAQVNLDKNTIDKDTRRNTM